MEVPDAAAMRQQFDAWLREDPEKENPEQYVKMRALGVSKGR